MSFESCRGQWFAVRVRTRWERLTASLLDAKGYQTLLPTGACPEGKNGRKSCAPLFPGYVFCQFNALERLPILVTPGVIGLAGRGRVPVPVEASEIEAILRLVSSGLPADPWPYMEVGQKVRIEDDALRGLEGILVAFRGGHRIVLSISLLRRSVAMEIDRARVSPVRAEHVAGVDLFAFREPAMARS